MDPVSLGAQRDCVLGKTFLWAQQSALEGDEREAGHGTAGSPQDGKGELFVLRPQHRGRDTGLVSQAHRFGTQSVYRQGPPQQKKGPVTLGIDHVLLPNGRGGDAWSKMRVSRKFAAPN